MTKQEILNRINEIIIEEKGSPVTIGNKFIDSDLDSLGTMIAFMTIDSEFPIFEGKDEDQAFTELDIPNLTVRELVTKCKLSIINTSTVPNSEMDT